MHKEFFTHLYLNIIYTNQCYLQNTENVSEKIQVLSHIIKI
jgi:hypothetical protein